MTKNNIFIILLALLPCVAGARERNISLQECLELSRNNSPEVRNAALDVSAARARRQEALSSWFPNVSASAYGFHALDPFVKIGLEDVLGSSDAANNARFYLSTSAGLAGISTEWSMLGNGYFGGVNVLQPVYAGGRIASGNALAVLGVKAAEVKKEIADRDNDDNVEKKYWAVVSLSEKKAALQQALDLAAKLEADVVSAREAGLVKESDVMQVRLKCKELETRMLKLRSGERLLKMDLFNLIGLSYKVLELDDFLLTDSFDGLQPPEHYFREEESVVASLQENRLLDMSVESKQLEKKMTMGEALPQLGVGAAYGYIRLIGEPRMNGAVFATVRIPISDWGKTARKMQRYDCEIEKARNQKDYLDSQLALKVHKEWVDLECAWEQMAAARDAVELSETLEAQKRGEYGNGLCTMAELLQCQTELQAARSAYVDSRIDYCNAVCEWVK
ncbi:MAG: TolC family protein [Bacteroidales bacterium]|nr:TolC family protein [Bacteroidales bacterium]